MHWRSFFSSSIVSSRNTIIKEIQEIQEVQIEETEGFNELEKLFNDEKPKEAIQRSDEMNLAKDVELVDSLNRMLAALRVYLTEHGGSENDQYVI